LLFDARVEKAAKGRLTVPRNEKASIVRVDMHGGRREEGENILPAMAK
jgi:hypothetical protein